MNFRFDKKCRPIAPKGSRAATATKKATKYLERLAQQQALLADEQATALQPIRSAVEDKKATANAIEARQLKRYQTKLERKVGEALLRTHDFYFDFGRVSPSPVDKDTQFFTLPFDTSWVGGIGSANENTGELAVGMIGGNASTSSALGLFLSSPTNVIADCVR